MESGGIASETDGKGGEEIATDPLEGDIIWVESRGNSWWPAQVVDENGVSGCLKPDNRLEGQILVRLYGSYTYVYADPVRCCSEFDIVLKQNNGRYREIFQKALEQDRLQLKSKKSRAQGSKYKDKKPNQNKLGSPSNTSTGGRITRGMKANMDPSTSVSHKNQKAATSSAGQTSKHKELKRSGSIAEEGDEKTPGQDKKHKPSPSDTEPSSRRVRVMQSLGLVAPPGSPFHAKRQTEGCD